jgi:hypothetical protein
LLSSGADERDIGAGLGLSRADVELILRHLQHSESGRMITRTSGT